MAAVSEAAWCMEVRRGDEELAWIDAEEDRDANG